MLRLYPFLLLLAACGGKSPPPETAVGDPAETPQERRERRSLEDALGEDDPEGADDGNIGVEGTLGELDDTDVAATVNRNASKLAACHEQAGQRYVGGKVRLKVRVNRDGSVKWAQVLESDLGAWPVERCLLGVARGMTFKKPRGGEGEAQLPIDLPAQGGKFTVGTDPAALPKLAATAAVSCEGSSEGVSSMTVYVGPGGAITQAGFAGIGEAEGADTWADCMHAAALAWKTKDPRGRIEKLTVGLE